jgi:hypothetical protein
MGRPTLGSLKVTFTKLNSMKITEKDYSDLKGKIIEALQDRSAPQLLEHYRKEGFGKDPERLLCFNIFRKTDLDWRTEFMDGFYQYANDDHLFTALKKICFPT